jgi:putative transposase
MIQITGRKEQEATMENSLAHTKWDCVYHIVWIPKYRRKIMFGQYRLVVIDILRELVAKKPGLEIVEGHACPDHIHLCMRIPPKYSVANVLGYLKGKSAMMLPERIPEWRKNTGRERTVWARGYYASTVGKDEAMIREYIKNQENADKNE